MSGVLSEAAAQPGLQPPAGDRIAIVGGCGAFGRALVESCLKLGLRVAVMDLPVSIEQHRPDGVDAAIAVDATVEESVRAGFDEVGATWGGLDGLVNLAGFATTPPVSVEELSVAEWDRVVDGSLRTTFLTCRAALPLLRTGREASIVNMSSGLAFKSRPGFSSYTAAKAGVVGLTKTIAIENAPEIRANAVAPSAAATEFLHGGTHLSAEERSSAAWMDIESYVAATPLRRLCEPADVVAPILFLLGPGSRFITGQTVHINGGRETF
ncbi:SDR family NAD(P)-dependent oxidoreductase [Streptomyces sp. B21-101]|uniref:SDR family NAD(P)-dependent oxidoreductase n=1 Tax=Streptomyces sp. B21-101 TaxID=3039415 RepID=UPI002FF40E11